MQRRGAFIVLEGIDGSGKATQMALLVTKLRARGYDVATFDFPRYGMGSSYFVTRYLNGGYGSAEAAGPYAASLFYALDRFDAGQVIRSALDAGKIVIANRYVGSNMAHQGAKIQDPQVRQGYFIWLDNLEYEVLGSPRPDMSFILKVPPFTAQSHVDQKETRTYTDAKRDLHEADIAHMLTASNIYDDLNKFFPRDFQVIDCVHSGVLLDVDIIHKLLWQKVEAYLPPLEQPEDSARSPEPAGQRQLSILADTLLGIREEAAHQPQPTPQTPRDSDDWVHVPAALSGKVKDQYVEGMQQLRTMYDESSAALRTYLDRQFPDHTSAQHAAVVSYMLQHILPLATLVPVSLPDSSVTEDALVSPDEALTPIRDIAAASLPHNHANEHGAVTLVSAEPRNELSLVPQILYQFSDQPLEDIKAVTRKWPHDKKTATLRTFLLGQTDADKSSIRENVRYGFDIISEFVTLRRLLPFMTGVSLQPVSPRLGFDMPRLVEAAGLDELFEQCFGLSLQLYSLLQSAGLPTEAQYAVLMGHRLRWHGDITLAELVKLQNSGVELVAELCKSIASKHPIIAASL